ncbi:ABC transporter substrate-binding protein [Polymorphospora lycopeni]|uniref:ABC transporter substrate-binding protein n=1 Tax=Polymorphospora lycopeni TaxID=3140240 RepID=A0ABV5D2N6_9ACTN
MRVRRVAAWTTAALVVAFGASACTGGDDVPADTIVVGLAEPAHLIPSNTVEPNGAQVLAALFTPLVGFDAEHRPVPLAAESVESEDNLEWTVRLKPDFTFHNGEKVTADSYVNAWNHAAYGPNGQAGGYLFEKVDGYADLQKIDPDGPDGERPAAEPKARTLTGLAKVDDLTFTVRLSAPFAEFPSVLGHRAFLPLPASAWQAEGVLKPDFEQAVVGQGPFRLKGTWQRGAPIEVERYDAYPAEKPRLRGVQFRVYDQLSAGLADVTDGETDLIRNIPAASVDAAQEALGDRLRNGANSAYQFLAFPTYEPEFASPEVRRAISMAIDRDAVDGSGDQQAPARSFVSPLVAGARPDTCGEACVFDAAKARAAYEAAKGPAALRITFNDDGGHREWVDAVCGQLRTNLGVECEAVAEPTYRDVLRKVDARQPVGLFRQSWSMDYPSMENYLGPLYASGGSSNYSGFSDAGFDALLREAGRAADQAAAITKYQEAEALLAEQVPVLPLRFGRESYGHSERVRNVETDAYGQIDLLKIELTG